MTLEVVVSRAGDFFAMEHAFAVRALIASVLVGAMCGGLGVVLVLRRLAMLGDAMGHATLPGIVGGFLLVQAKNTLAMYAGAVASALLAALVVARLNDLPKTRSDANLGIVLVSFFGLGVVLQTFAQNSPSGAQAGINHYFFGNAAAIAPDQLNAVFVCAVFASVSLAVSFRPLMLGSFDPTFATVHGVPTRALDRALLAMLAIVIVVSAQTVGIILVAAMLVIPAQTALLVARTPAGGVAGAVAFGALSGAVGAFASFVFDGVPTGPAMALTAAALFAATLLVRRA